MYHENHLSPLGQVKSTFSHSITLALPEGPLYCPVCHSYRLHSPINHLPFSVLSFNSIESADIVNRFLTQELFLTMASTSTNLYAQKKCSEALLSVKGREWNDITPSELQIWIEILIYMELFSGKVQQQESSGFTISITLHMISADS